MKKFYYILTTETKMVNFDNKDTALEEYNKLKSSGSKHLRLERANFETGTARVIRQKNNIW